MANPGHLEILKKGAEAWNEWRRAYPDIEPDLSRAMLDGPFLPEVDFRGALLTGANLTKAHLFDARFDRAQAARVNLSFAWLERASFVGTNLTSCQLVDAQLYDADMTDAVLRRADLSFSRNALEELLQAPVHG